MERKAVFIVLAVLAVLAGCGVLGCLPEAEQKFKDALPSEDDLKITMGETDNGEAAKRALGDCPECCVDEETGGYFDSETYIMTRGATYHVNGTLVAVYVWLNFIVSEPYSEEIENGYVWGPWDNTDIDPLSRLSYRFQMIENSDSSFEYSLEAKLTTDETAPWTPYVYGEVVPAGEPHKGKGTLIIDFDVLHELDSSHPSQYHGLVSYDFDVRQASPSAENPNRVATSFVEFWEDPGLGEEDPEPLNAEYLYERYDQLSGKLAFEASADFTGPDDEPDGVDELFNVESRWDSVGKGIGAATISGGSLNEMNVGSYTLTECWADSTDNYYETYDIETVTFTDGTDPLEEQNCGDAANCPVF